MLVQHLPPGSALHIAFDADAAWPVEAHLLAFAVDVLQVANWQRGGGKGDKPKPIPRPGEASRREVAKDRIALRAEAFQKRQQQREA